MQLDIFNSTQAASRPALELLEHASGFYGPRTGVNARSADVTVAMAVDFNTAGEKLTHKVAGARYVGIALGSDVDSAAQALTAFLRRKEARTLNVAGNGIYTLSKHGHTQESTNEWVYRLLLRVVKAHPLEHIRSGGQTGVDQAGLVAAVALGVPATGLFPKGFLQRNQQGVDAAQTAEIIRTTIHEQAACLGHICS